MAQRCRPREHRVVAESDGAPLLVILGEAAHYPSQRKEQECRDHIGQQRTGAPLRRGDPVVLVSRTGGVEVRMPGRALGPAQTGGRIGVENVSSRRVLRGRLVAEGLVELLP